MTRQMTRRFKCVYCEHEATRAVCEPAEPWLLVCDEHCRGTEMGNVPIADYDRVNSYVPKMFGGTYER